MRLPRKHQFSSRFVEYLAIFFYNPNSAESRMCFRKRYLLWALLFFVFSAIPASQSFAQKAAPGQQNAATPAPANPALMNAGGEKTADQSDSALLPGEVPVPIDAEKINEAGEILRKRIDTMGIHASVRVGRWIDATAFNDLTWLKLFVCLGLVLLVLALERSVRYVIGVRLSKTADTSGRSGLTVCSRLFPGRSPFSFESMEFIGLYLRYGAISILQEARTLFTVSRGRRLTWGEQSHSFGFSAGSFA